MKLPAKQAALVKHLQSNPDAKVHFFPYMGRFNPSDHYSCFGFGRCTPAAAALARRGLLKMVNKKTFSREHDLVLTDAGKSWLAPQNGGKS